MLSKTEILYHSFSEILALAMKGGWGILTLICLVLPHVLLELLSTFSCKEKRKNCGNLMLILLYEPLSALLYKQLNALIRPNTQRNTYHLSLCQCEIFGKSASVSHS